MLKSLIALSLIFVTASAFAGTEYQKICYGGMTLYGKSSQLAVNIHEQDYSNGVGRGTDVSMRHDASGEMVGKFNSSESSSTKELILSAGASNYVGSFGLDHKAKTLTLEGTLTIQGLGQTPVHATIPCEEYLD